MTNEEKAREIGEFFETTYLAALEMAEWKDQQFKEYLEKKKAEMQPAIERLFDEYEQGYFDGRESAIYEIINELFGEE